MTHSVEENVQTLLGARSILLEVAATKDMREKHPVIAPLCDEDVLGRIIDLAYRHQFEEDRYPFKRDIRELEQIVFLKAKQQRDGLS
jgi:hypothetical protein